MTSENDTVPRLKLRQFWWEERGYYQLASDCKIVGKNWTETVDCLDEYAVWESEIFGDWWEPQNTGNIFVSGSGQNNYRHLVGLIPIDRQRGLCFGETFRLMRREKMTSSEKQERKQLLEEGKLELRSRVSEEERAKAASELVLMAVAFPHHYIFPFAEKYRTFVPREYWKRLRLI